MSRQVLSAVLGAKDLLAPIIILSIEAACTPVWIIEAKKLSSINPGVYTQLAESRY